MATVGVTWKICGPMIAYVGQIWTSDTYTDQESLADTDDRPEVAGTSSIDRIGCIDSDGDGISDLNDFYPNDATRSRGRD